MSEYKNKLQLSDAENTRLEGTVSFYNVVTMLHSIFYYRLKD